MFNWSTDTSELKKNPKQYSIWKLEQQINFGLNGKKIDGKKLRKYLPSLNIFDASRKNYLSFLLDEKEDPDFVAD